MTRHRQNRDNSSEVIPVRSLIWLSIALVLAPAATLVVVAGLVVGYYTFWASKDDLENSLNQKLDNIQMSRENNLQFTPTDHSYDMNFWLIPGLCIAAILTLLICFEQLMTHNNKEAKMKIQLHLDSMAAMTAMTDEIKSIKSKPDNQTDSTSTTSESLKSSNSVEKVVSGVVETVVGGLLGGVLGGLAKSAVGVKNRVHQAIHSEQKEEEEKEIKVET